MDFKPARLEISKRSSPAAPRLETKKQKQFQIERIFGLKIDFGL